MDQTWSNWIKLDQLGSTWLKLDQIGLNWIKLDQIVETWGWGLVPHPYLIFCLVIFDYWKTWLKLVMLENLQACFSYFLATIIWLYLFLYLMTVQNLEPKWLVLLNIGAKSNHIYQRKKCHSHCIISSLQILICYLHLKCGFYSNFSHFSLIQF